MAAPPLLRVVGPQTPARNLLVVALVEALRARGYRTATAERLHDGRPSVRLPSGGRVTPAPGTQVGELAAFVASLDPRADLVLAEGDDEPGAPAIELLGEGGRGGAGSNEDRLATIEAPRLLADFETRGAEAVAHLAALIDERLLGGEPASGRGLLARLRGLGRG